MAQLAMFMKALMKAVGQRGGSLAERARSQRVFAWRFLAMIHADVAVVLPKACTNERGVGGV